MKKHCEKSICFNFDDNFWEYVIKFDEHTDYKKIEKLDNSKGVDFLSINNKNICFIEVKDFRNYIIKDKQQLMTDVAHKVRDSLACIVAANRNSTHNLQMWNKALDVLSNVKKNVTVILWLEKYQKPRKTNSKREKQSGFDYKRQLENKLRWLLPNVVILNRRDYYKKELQNKFKFDVDFIKNAN